DRGCRFVCDFCSIHSFYGSNVRVRPIRRVVEELEQIDRKKLLFFVDDNLFSTEENVKLLLAAIKPLKLNWSCQISIDIARDKKMLDLMAEAGCKFTLIGFESLNKDNLKEMRKNWNHVSGSYQDVVKELHQRGIGIYGTFVFGYDHDTVETIRESLDFAIESKLEIANFNPLTPTPASELYNRLRDEGRMISPEWWLDSNYRYGSPIFTPKLISAELMNEKCFEAKKEFYSWSSIGNRVLLSDTKFSFFGRSMSAVANIISRKEIYNKQGRALGC
ncbi:MAG TPA: radical SAM protein, partial [Alphaproteobacteria bacterium]|nr:radical SAM protein [Alphaproteobacteria bacterium]